jgi:hypothetical protein
VSSSSFIETLMYGWQSKPPTAVYVTAPAGVKHHFRGTNGPSDECPASSTGPLGRPCGILHLIESMVY